MNQLKLNKPGKLQPSESGFLPDTTRVLNWRMKELAIAPLLFLLLICAACRQQPSAPGGLPLTRIDTIRGLTAEIAAKGLPVKIRAIVTYIDPASNLFFVHDKSQGIYVEMLGRDLSLSSGSLIELEGKTDRGTITPIILDPQVKQLGQSEFPAASFIPLAELLDGKQECQWIETQGVVRSLKRVGDRVQLEVADLSAQLQVVVYDYPGANARDLVDARIQFRGVVGVHANANREIVKVQLFVPSQREIHILDPAPQDLFSLPVQSISKIQQMSQSSLQPHRVRVQGAAMPREPGQPLMVQDSTGNVELISDQPNLVKPGDRLDVIGFLSVREHKLLLENAIFVPFAPPPSPSMAANSLPALTEIAKIRKLSGREARKNYPVKVRGVVTYADPDPPMIFVQDASWGIYVNTLSQPLDLKTGHLVEIEGNTEAGATYPVIFTRKVRDLGMAPLPAAKSVTVDQFFYGEADSLRVELEGIVRTVSGDSDHAFLELVSGGIRFPVIIPGYQNRRLPLELVDSRIRIRGSVGILVNLKNQINGSRLYTPDIRDITIIQSAPGDPFSMPIRPINSLMNFSSGNFSGHRIRIQGSILYNQLGRYFYIRDASGSTYVQTRQEIGAVPGSVVDVVGFPTLGNPVNTLEDAIFKNQGDIRELSVKAVSAEQALSGQYHGDLIRIEAELLSQSNTSTGQALVLKARKTIFEAALDDQKSMTPALTEGSHLELTGICLHKMEPTQGPSFKLLLRTSRDIRILKNAPWWTPIHTAWILGIFLLAILISFSWGITLKQRIKQQTLIIRQRIEHEAVLEKEYRELFENSNDVVFAFDLDGMLTSFNKAGESLIGYTHQELLRMTFAQILAPGQAQAVQERIRQKIAGSPSVPFEIELLAKDGHRISMEVTADLIYREGKPTGLRGIGRDVTQRKQANAALKASEDRLRQAQKLESIGTLAGGIAHDFNNILGAIIGYAELSIIDARNPEAIIPNQEQILAAGRRARDLIRQILTFSRKLEQERKPILLQDIVEETSTLLRATLPSTIDIQLKIDPACKPVWADPSQMHQIVMNLATNAGHAMRSEGGILTLGVSVVKSGLEVPGVSLRDWEGEGVCLFVSDTGRGMQADTVKRIFDPYFTTKPVGDGSGLGLAVVHGIVQSHKGAIQVESQPGEGAVFRIYLPCSEVKATEPVVEKTMQLPRGKGNILFVDDEEVIVDLEDRTLQRLGYSVTAKKNSLEALAAFQAAPDSFDLVITDQTMPHMTGLRLARELKKIRPELPIILCTGFSEEASPEKALQAGISIHLFKPVSTRDLAQAIQKAMDKKTPDMKN